MKKVILAVLFGICLMSCKKQAVDNSEFTAPKQLIYIKIEGVTLGGVTNDYGAFKIKY